MIRFTIGLDKDGYRARLWSGSDLIWWTEGYERKADALNAVRSPRRPTTRRSPTGRRRPPSKGRGPPGQRAALLILRQPSLARRDLVQRLAQQLPLVVVQSSDPLSQHTFPASLGNRCDLAREVGGEDHLHVAPTQLLDCFGGAG